MLSASYQKDHWCFAVWAPEKETMLLHVVSPFEEKYSMQKNNEGYFFAEVFTKEKSLHYFFRPDDKNDFPDPASQYQPDGVHKASQTIDHSDFNWTDTDWKNISLSEWIIYELHVGLFASEGTFEAIISRLDDLKNLGVNVIELMPIAQFPGNRNWGYDGVYPYAVQNSYGGPEGLKKLVDACHRKGIGVVLDVVYNHLGPEGNYFSQFGPYFTDKYKTPWGDAINFDGEWSDGVRDYFSDNAIYWFKHYHIDGLRCDAVHAVFDNGAIHFWELLHNKVKQLEEKLNKQLYLIAESDLNSPKVVKLPAQGGYGFDAQWLDDFHHALYVLINSGEQQRYYDFGKIDQLVKSYNEGFVHSGEWVKFRKRKHGASSKGIDGDKFIIFNQNHDQIGNRADGKRLCMLVDYERVKLAAAAVLLAPYLPMLFMGEEYADQSPFFYFVSHSDENLIKAVQEGRKKEFKDFGFDETIPDPQDEKTFLRSKLKWHKRTEGQHKIIWQWHQKLIELRKTQAALKNFSKGNIHAEVINEKSFILFRYTPTMEEGLVCIFNFSDETIQFKTSLHRRAHKILDSKESQWLLNPNETMISHQETLEKNQTVAVLPLSVAVYVFS